MKAILLVIIALVVLVAGAVLFGASLWKNETNDLREKLQAARVPITPVSYDAREIGELPPPVQRYFRAVLKDGQPIIATARISHEGQFNMGETEEKWRPFTSRQVVVTRRPGFEWDGRIRLAPGIKVFVHDAYAGGEGILRAALLGLFTLADLRGTAELAQGELMRFMAEAVWYPTALLPRQGVQWEAIDASAARATLKDGAVSASLEYRFDGDGLVSAVRAESRFRSVEGALVATPWSGRFWGYEDQHGIRIPMQGEVAWELREGSWPYWRGRISRIRYEFAKRPDLKR